MIGLRKRLIATLTILWVRADAFYLPFGGIVAQSRHSDDEERANVHQAICSAANARCSIH